MNDRIAACEDAAYTEGLAAGLAAALDSEPAAAPPGAVTALPAARVPPGAEVLDHSLAAGEGIALVRREGEATAADPRASRTFTALLGAVRLGASRRLVGQAAGHLAARSAGGAPILSKQLVQAGLADSVIATEELRQRLLAPAPTTADLADVHDRLTALDWETVKLFGASGYVRGGPTGAAYASALLANCWVTGSPGLSPAQ